MVQPLKYKLSGIIIPIHRFAFSLPIVMLCCAVMSKATNAQTYCWPGVQIACFYGDQITNVSFGTINHADNACSADADGKKDFTTAVPAATLIPGNTYTLTVTLSVNSQAGAVAWIDFNRNNVFDASEYVSLGSRTSNGNLSVAITVPTGASSGESRLRVTNRKNNVNPMPGAGDACHSLSSYRGQVKDYAIYINAANPLPVELMAFEAGIGSDNILLTWATASEKNNSFFSIDRSQDGIHWTEIKKIKGRGNSTVTSHYSYSDANAMSGLNYYRLKQTDHDLKCYYSKTIDVNYTRNNTHPDIYPNPFNDYLIIEGKYGTEPPLLYNSQGELMRTSVSYADPAITINTNDLPKGIYVLIYDYKRYTFIKN